MRRASRRIWSGVGERTVAHDTLSGTAWVLSEREGTVTRIGR